MGGSNSTASSTQQSNQILTQQFSANCGISCQNYISDVSMTFINTVVNGDIDFTQKCATNGTCITNSNMDAIADSLFKTANSATTNYPGLLGFEYSSTSSSQVIKQSITQQTNEQCNISSYNELNDVSILAVNSQINGNIEFTQEGQTGTASTPAECSLNNSMRLAAIATGMSENTSFAGKKAKGNIIKYIIIGIVLVIIAFVVSSAVVKLFKHDSQDKNIKAIEEARAKAGCPGGATPLLDKKGKVLIDHTTHRPVCPPPPLPTYNITQSPQVSSFRSPPRQQVEIPDISSSAIDKE